MVLAILICSAILVNGSLSLSADDGDAHPSYFDSYEIGLGQQIVLGHWVPITLKNVRWPEGTSKVGVVTTDGSGNRHRYLLEIDQAKKNFQGYVRFGRKTGGINIEFLNTDNEVVGQASIGDSEILTEHVFQPAIRPLYLTVGSEINLNQVLGLNRFRDDLGERITGCHQHDLNSLPDSSIGYSSLDTLFLTTEDAEQLSKLTEKQISAIEDWVKQGGRLIVSTGANSVELFGQAGPLETFAISPIQSTGRLENTSRLETYAGSREPLVKRDDEPLQVAVCSGESCIINLVEKPGPIIFRKAVGLGEITFVTIDLDGQRVQEWPGFARLTANLIGYEFESGDPGEGTRSGRVTHIGFEDLAGQLRAALDQFETVRFINFTLVAVLVALFVLLIGPVDYFLLSRVFKKMELTWVTFIASTLIFCGIAFWLHGISKPGSIQINQIDLIDFDQATGQVRGRSWVHLYVPKNNLHEIEYETNGNYFENADTVQVTWQGLPGTGLGGMGASSGLASGAAVYDCSFKEVDEGLQCFVDSIPIQSASTKSFVVDWTGESKEEFAFRLTQNKNKTRLSGSISNPFDFELNNAVIFHGNAAYLFDEPIEANGTASIGPDTRFRNIRVYYTKSQTSSQQDEKRRWDVQSFDVTRIMEMMMFFDVAGGSSYTNLTNQYEDSIDLSHLLSLDRAVLLGRVKRATNSIKVDGESTEDNLDKKWTFVRIVFPVETK